MPWLPENSARPSAVSVCLAMMAAFPDAASDSKHNHFRPLVIHHVFSAVSHFTYWTNWVLLNLIFWRWSEKKIGAINKITMKPFNRFERWARGPQSQFLASPVIKGQAQDSAPLTPMSLVTVVGSVLCWTSAATLRNTLVNEWCLESQFRLTSYLLAGLYVWVRSNMCPTPVLGQKCEWIKVAPPQGKE